MTAARRTAGPKRRGWSLAGGYVGWMALFIVIPMLLIVLMAFGTEDGHFTLQNFARMLDYGSVFGRSFALAAIATAICILLGYPLAYILSKESARVQQISAVLMMLPMWINMLLRTYAWMSILENNGFLNNFFALIGLPRIQMINTAGAVVLGMVYNYLPFMVLPVYTVMVKLDSSLIEAAQDLGGNSFTVFRRVIFPLSLPGVLSGVTMVFVPSVSTFIISALLGGSKVMLLGDLIELQFLGGAYNPHLGSAISLVMMLIVFVCVTVMNRFGEGEEEVMIL